MADDPAAVASAGRPVQGEIYQGDTRFNALAEDWLRGHCIISEKMTKNLAELIAHAVDSATKPLHAQLEAAVGSRLPGPPPEPVRAALEAILDDAIGSPHDALWIVRREFIEAAKSVIASEREHGE
jgi:hypothetical protein